jgi:type IV pilus assembly protein PilZ
MSKKTPTKKNEKSPSKAAPQSGSIADRVDHRVPIQLLVDYKSDGHYLFDFCRDLGTGGVFIETKSPLSTGSEIELTFTIPDSKETLRTKGTVIWSQAPIAGRTEVTAGMGVQFNKFTDTQRKTLSDFIQRYGGKNAGGPSQRRAG